MNACDGCHSSLGIGEGCGMDQLLLWEIHENRKLDDMIELGNNWDWCWHPRGTILAIEEEDED